MINLKYSYPNFDYNLNPAPSRDTQKWIEVARKAYHLASQGFDKSKAIANLTSDWDKIEKMDFNNWLRYYEEGAQLKYKKAQMGYWGNSNQPGYFIPLNHSKPEINNVQNQVPAEPVEPKINPIEEKREAIEEQRKKVISRLNSVEKLLNSPEGHLFAGKELESILDVIFSLKKKIHMVNKITLSTKLYEDMIIREANGLAKRGFNQASEILIKVAQQMPAPAEPSNPTTGGGLPGNLPGEGPGMTPPPGPTQMPGELSEGMKQFLEGLDTGNVSFDDKEDDLEVNESQDDKLEVFDLAVEAQVVNPKNNVFEEERPDNFSKKMDQVLENCTIQDVIKEFEFISDFFKAREIPRRLSKADMMLDSLGLSTFFPTLGEAQTKSLDSNNYISTRIDEILSRLKSSVKSQAVELEDNMGKKQRPDIAPIKQNLQNTENKEEARRQLRKDLANQELEKQAPEVEMSEDLNQPVKVAPQPPQI